LDERPQLAVVCIDDCGADSVRSRDSRCYFS